MSRSVEEPSHRHSSKSRKAEVEMSAVQGPNVLEWRPRNDKPPRSRLTIQSKLWLLDADRPPFEHPWRKPISRYGLPSVKTMTIKCISGACDTVPIETWGGSPLKRNMDVTKPMKLVIIQHTVSSDCSSDAECEKIVKSIRNLHIERGFDDIGLSFIIGGNGKIYECAGWKVGAHTRTYNSKSISLSFVGDFREKLPTPQALKAAQDFISCSVNNNNIDSNYNLVGHLQLSPTLSPGAKLQNLIKSWPHWLSDVSGI